MIRKVLYAVLGCFCLLSIFGCDNKQDNPEPIDPEEPVDPGDTNEIRKGTFDRSYPEYYQKKVPLVEGSHVVYINWDGFARYYFDELVKSTIDKETLTLKKIFSEGTSFSNLRTTVPSITNPCQNMILSGATSSVTNNVYRYYDFISNTVIQQARENKALTLPEVAVSAGIKTVSVHQYLSQSVSGVDYITADSTNPKVVARGSLKYSDHFSRMEQLIKIVKKEPVISGGKVHQYTELPRLILFYADDLDAIGHNEKDNYGYKRATTEANRMKSVITLIKEMDAKLGEFIQACKDANVYDKMTFFFTSDHGMTPFGRQVDGEEKYTKSQLTSLLSAIKNHDSNLVPQMLTAGATPSSASNVYAVGMNLNIQLSFKNKYNTSQMNKLKEALLKEKFVGKVLTKTELSQMGYWSMGADMIISPAEHYTFSANTTNSYIARAQHDSLQDSANIIYGCIWGKGIKKDYVYAGQAFNYDFGITMAACLGIDLPQANGIVLDIFARE